MAIILTGAGKPGGSPALPYFAATAALGRSVNDAAVALSGTNMQLASTSAITRGAVVNHVEGGPQSLNAVRVNTTNRHMVP